MVLLEVNDLKTYFFSQKGVAKAVDGVDFTLDKGKAFGLVGESGCGKTTLALSILRLILPPGRIVEGEILLEGRDLLELSESELREIRWKKISLVFQSAMSSLNPVIRIGEQISEALLAHEKISKEFAKNKVKELFQLVGLDSKRMYSYPHELSGGMKQRALIGMALACEPDLLIADEPVTALDVVIQARIIKLLKDLQKKLKLSMLIISHNLPAITQTCEKAGVMYAGKMVECADIEDLLNNAKHPYTIELLKAIPDLKGKKEHLHSIPGDVPSPLRFPTGCRFHPRCSYAMKICRKQEPKSITISKGHLASCHLLG
jgi:peptide/nickel transport system ATP-binding protein